mmetsp:Transcript_54434/g.127291  ORF Transcript_54434/g.127291 Transcript_54434/m.127291 type:complete len:256 (-) Transcript_54434:157-924(-)
MSRFRFALSHAATLFSTGKTPGMCCSAPYRFGQVTTRSVLHCQSKRWNQAYAPPPSQGEVLRKNSNWRWAEGTGRPTPPGGGLDTDQYTVFLNIRNTIALELYHGSTGAIMFRPAALPQESAQDQLRTKPQTPVRASARWLGWDGDTKDQLEGTWDFSAWLAPDVVGSLDQDWQDFNQPLVAGSREFGYWTIVVPDRGFPPQGTTCAVLTNAKSNVRIVLTTEGFAFETDDGKSLLLVNGPQPLLLPKESLPEIH